MEPKSFRFKSIEIIYRECLGRGAYGAVYKAKCDELTCAAKVLYPILRDLRGQGQVDPKEAHRSPCSRFIQEIEILCKAHHPNIVQYLGTFHDHSTNSPVLLMELMDESLTHFLERSQTPIPSHIQVNICHDIALALSFLHSNGIIHRDLSSNNVLMIRGDHAKVTDFGMAAFETAHSRNTENPGNAAYMPPEVKNTKQVTTSDKIDCFSFGVLIIQILTQKFPQPNDNVENSVVRSYFARYEPEIERRNNHISLVPKDNPLLSIANKCLKYKHNDRPTSEDLCRSLSELNSRDSHISPLPKRELNQASYSDTRQQPESLDNITPEPYSRFKFHKLCENIDEVDNIEEFEHVEVTTPLFDVVTQVYDHSESTPIRWLTRRQRAPECLYRKCDAVLLNNSIYFLHGVESEFLCSFNPLYHEWNVLPNCLVKRSSLAVVNGAVITVGGLHSAKLYNLVENKEWKSKLPSMPTKRCDAVIAYSNSHLVVAGGIAKKSFLTTVEVMDTDNLQWFTTADFPEPCAALSAQICTGKMYVLGNKNSVYSCDIDTLVNSSGAITRLAASLTARPEPVWKEVEQLPVSSATSVVYKNKLYAVGGKLPGNVPSAAVYQYNSAQDRWRIISYINIPRSQCFASILDTTTMVVIGGVSREGHPMNEVETATWYRR